MAINAKDYPNKIEPGLLADKGFDKFFYRFQHEGKQKKGIIDYSTKQMDKRTRITKAKTELTQIKQDLADGHSASAISLDKLFQTYSNTNASDTNWAKIKQGAYNRYIQGDLGAKHIDKIKEMHVTKIISKMKNEGLSPRTQKTILEILKPLFNFAVKNKYIKENPIADLTVKIPSQKKVVTNATDNFTKIYNGILKYYDRKPFYQALFLFGILSGRRKSEILNLKWENIDFDNNYYWIEDTKNDESQKFPLPAIIKEKLLEFDKTRTGLVFKSPVTGGVISNLDRQMRQLKKHLEMPEISMHYMRNILVSAYAEQGVEAVTLSGILGHKNSSTINKYLSLNYLRSGEKGIEVQDKILKLNNDTIDAEVIE